MLKVMNALLLYLTWAGFVARSFECVPYVQQTRIKREKAVSNLKEV